MWDSVPTFEKLPVAVQRRILQMQLASLNVAPDFDLVERLRQSADSPISINSKLSVLRDAKGMVRLKSVPLIEFSSNKLAMNLKGRAGATDVWWDAYPVAFGHEQEIFTSSMAKRRVNFLMRTKLEIKSHCVIGVQAIGSSPLASSRRQNFRICSQTQKFRACDGMV